MNDQTRTNDEQKATELVVPPMTTARTPIMAGRSIRAIIPNNLAEVAKLAAVIHESGLAPQGLDSVQKVAVAMMYGAEIGLPPMQAIQSIAVINGRPSIYGDAGMALILNSGLCETFKEWFEGKPYDDDFTAHCLIKRKGDPLEVHEEYSVADAKRAKLWDKKTSKGGDTPWVTNPKRMMKFRARSFASRDKFADGGRGLRFAEEAQDDPQIEIEAPTIAARLPGPREDRKPIDAHEIINGKAEPEKMIVVQVEGLEPKPEITAPVLDDGLTDNERKLIADLAADLEPCKTQKEIDVVAGDYAPGLATVEDGLRLTCMKLITAKRDALMAAKPKGKKKPEAEKTLV